MEKVMGNSLWQLVAQSDKISQFVLLVLLGMSILCWTVFLYKMVLLRIKKRHMQRAVDKMKNVQSIDEMVIIAGQLDATAPGYFLTQHLNFLKSMVEKNKQRGKGQLDAHDLEFVQQHLGQQVELLMYSDDSYVSLLSTSAAVSPLLGLFGTVWGLIHSFIRISERQSADIVTVAPGIAEALITTLAGLIVAIPALIMFNYLLVKTRELEQFYTMLADKIVLVVERTLVSRDSVPFHEPVAPSLNRVTL